MKPYFVAAWVSTARPDDPPELTEVFDDQVQAWGFVDSLPGAARKGVEWRVYRLARVWPLGESAPDNRELQVTIQDERESCWCWCCLGIGENDKGSECYACDGLGVNPDSPPCSPYCRLPDRELPSVGQNEISVQSSESTDRVVTGEAYPELAVAGDQIVIPGVEIGESP